MSERSSEKVRDYKHQVLAILRGQTPELKDIPPERLDWSGIVGVMHLAEGTWGPDRRALMRAMGQIIETAPKNPTEAANLLDIASAEGWGDLRPSVEKLARKKIGDDRILDGMDDFFDNAEFNRVLNKGGFEMNPLEIQELEDVRENTSFQRAYFLSVKQKRLAFLFVDGTDSVLSWDGAIDFSRLERVGLYEITGMLAQHCIRLTDYPETRGAVKARFVVKDREDNQANLVHLDLKDPKQFSRYRRVLKKPDRIMDALFDVDAPGYSPPLSYCFNAENPKVYPDEKVQMALRVPRSCEWPVDVLGNLVVRYNYERDSFAGKMDAHDAIKKINALCVKESDNGT